MLRTSAKLPAPMRIRFYLTSISIQKPMILSSYPASSSTLYCDIILLPSCPYPLFIFSRESSLCVFAYKSVIPSGKQFRVVLSYGQGERDTYPFPLPPHLPSPPSVYSTRTCQAPRDCGHTVTPLRLSRAMDIYLLLSAAQAAPGRSESVSHPSPPFTTSPVSIQTGSANDRLVNQIEATEHRGHTNTRTQAVRSLPRPLNFSESHRMPVEMHVGRSLPPFRLGPAKTAVFKPVSDNGSGAQCKPFRCPEPDCDASFGQKGSLTRHTKSRHEKLRPHACDLCGKTFSERWTRSVHIRNVHLKSKPHKCHLCDKAFGEVFNKSKHIAIVHEGKRPFECPTCHRAFGYKGDMRKHVMELHEQTGRPFQCNVESCGVKFARKRYLRRHQNLSHKGMTIQDDYGTPSSPATPGRHGGPSSIMMEPLTPLPPSVGAPQHEQKPDYTALHTLSLFASTAKHA